MTSTTADSLPTTDTPLAAIALAGDAYAAVLDRHRLDFCCAGRRTLAQACAAAGLAPEQLLVEMAAEARARAGAETGTDWRAAPLPSVIRHVVDTHHRFTRDAVSRIEPLMAKVEARHGQAHPELTAVAGAFRQLAAEMMPHMAREEQVLFPYIVALCTETQPRHAPFGSLANPLRVMTADHEAAGRLLDELRTLTSSFTPPPGACTSYRALYAALQDLRRDLMVHVALENEVLFPRALELAPVTPQPGPAPPEWESHLSPAPSCWLRP